MKKEEQQAKKTKKLSNLIEIEDVLNEKKYESLNHFLRYGIDWDSVSYDLIRPKKARAFAESIEDEEVRMDVLKFMHMYARQYFLETAESVAYRDKVQNAATVSLVDIPDKSAEDLVILFQQELSYLIKQIEESGEYTGDRFATMQRRVANLEELVKELEKENEKLKDRLDWYENPSEHGKYIPEKLDRQEFYNIMRHLEEEGIVRCIGNYIGSKFHVDCFIWLGTKKLFGYFVYRMNDVFGIRGGRDILDWKIFEPAFQNYDKIIGEAQKWGDSKEKIKKNQKNSIKNAEKIEKAIEKMNCGAEEF